VPIVLSEPNVLVLDRAEWCWNNGPWQPREELLRVGNHARSLSGLPPNTGRIAQPWTDRKPAEPLGRLSLRFAIESEVPVMSSELGIENPSAWEMRLDGRPLANRPRGWWVDESIRRVPLRKLGAGSHELTLSIDFTRRTNVEWCYLLGDFGVSLAGRHARLIAPVRRLAFGDWGPQGLPFYSGNVTYRCSLKGKGKAVRIAFSRFKSPLLVATIDGKQSQRIAFAPFHAEFARVDRGQHTVEITAFGNRFNAFGHFHNIDPQCRGGVPDAWRSVGENWAYEYQLRPMGILVAPRVFSRG
jgi:hypothetical protein